MVIGFANLFSWRPHMEHMVFLARSCIEAGIPVRFLNCDSGLPSCYAREIRQEGRIKACAKCMLGSIRGYEANSITAINNQMAGGLSASECDDLSFSSAATLTRIEDKKDAVLSDFKAYQQHLAPSIQVIYANTIRWIEKEKLTAIVLFNGRMDITAGLLQAAKDKGLPVITHERAWYGDGLHMVMNQNCLGIKALQKMVADYDDIPLLYDQAHQASLFIIRRFLGQKTNEWRTYNPNREYTSWPRKLGVGKAPKILVLPSSTNEVIGHQDWTSYWENNGEALTELLAHFKLDPSHYVVRGHPNWSETIGSSDGGRIDAFYKRWCQLSGVHYIAPSNKASTQSLMAQADIIITNGSTAALEAGFLGKRIINIGQAPFSTAGFVEAIITSADMRALSVDSQSDKNIIQRKTLRYLYTHQARYTQFTDAIVSKSSANSDYFHKSVSKRLLNMIETGIITPYTTEVAEDSQAENDFIADINKGNWKWLLDRRVPKNYGDRLLIKRRFFLRWLHFARGFLTVGDR